MAASPNIVSHGDSMIFTKDEATAAQATWCFYLSNTADGTPATGKTIAGSDFRISKAGAAFDNAAGAVTEMSLGWYKMVFAAADLDTLGCLACELSVESGVDPLHVSHQVVALDLNVATVNPGTGGIVAASFAAGAIDAAAIAADALGSSELAAAAASEIRTGLATSAEVAAIALATRTVNVSLGTISVDGSTSTTGTGAQYMAKSMENALDVVISASGTWNGATLTAQVCEDPTAVVPVWTNTGTPLTADGTISITGPHNAFRVVLSDDGASTAVAVSAAIRKPVNT